MPDSEPFKVDVSQVAPGDVWKWTCRECGEISGVWYRFEGRAEELGIAHVHEMHGPRAVVNTVSFVDC